MKMLRESLSALCLVGFVGTAEAQTASFACPASQIAVEFSKGTKTTWTGKQEGQGCVTSSVLYFDPDRTRQGISYGPTLAATSQSTPAMIRFVQAMQAKLWPLEVGKSFTDRYEGPGFSGTSGIWIRTYKVEAFEKVVTPAGTFDAFKVTRTEDAAAGRYKETLTQWYAPALRVVIKYEFRNTNQLNRTEEAVRITR